MAGFGGSVKLTGESEYKKALSSITQNLKVVSAEMKATASSFDVGDKSIDEVAKDSQNLAKQLDVQKSALASLKSQLSSMTAEYNKSKASHEALVTQYNKEKAKLEEIGRTLGTSSNEYRAQEKVVAQLTQEVDKSGKSLEAEGKALDNLRIKTANAETSINKTSKSLDSLGKEAEESGKEAEKGGDGFTVMKGILANLASQAITACIQGLKNFAKEIGNTVAEVGKLGDEIDKESQKLGLSTDTYQALSYAMERSGSSISDVSKGMKNITTALDGVQKGTKGAGDAFNSLGVNLKNTDGSMKSAEKVLMETLTALGNMKDETARNATANKIFGKSYQELAPLLNAGADGIAQLMQEAKDYGMIMSGDAVKASASYQDSLLRMQGTMQGLQNNILGAFLPSLTQIMDGFSLLAIGGEGASEKITTGVQGLIDTFTNALPQVGNLIKMIADTIFANAPQIITSLTSGILSAIGEIAPMVTEVMTTLIDELLNHLPEIVNCGVDIITSLISGIGDALPSLISKIPEIIGKLVSSLMSNLPKLVESGIKLIGGLAKGLIQAIPQLIASIPQIIASIVKGLASGVGQMAEAGLNLIKGLWEGIGNAGKWIMDKIKGFMGNIVGGIKNFFGIKSPSRLMRDQIGDNLAKGIGVGFEDEMKNVSKQMQEAIPTDFDTSVNMGVSTTGTGMSSGYFDMVTAFKDALSQMKIELDDEVAGRFVENTVARAIYA